MLMTGRRMLVLFGRSKLFLARLASQARRASKVGWLFDSLFVLSLCVKILIQFIFEQTSEFDSK